MKTIYVKSQGTTEVPIVCDCGESIRIGKTGFYYCPKCDERVIIEIV